MAGINVTIDYIPVDDPYQELHSYWRENVRDTFFYESLRDYAIHNPQEEFTEVFPDCEISISFPENNCTSLREEEYEEVSQKAKGLEFTFLETNSAQCYSAFQLRSSTKEEVYLKKVTLWENRGDEWKWVEKAHYHSNDLIDRRIRKGEEYFEILYFEDYKMQKGKTYRVLIEGTQNSEIWYDFKWMPD